MLAEGFLHERHTDEEQERPDGELDASHVCAS